MGMKFTVSKTLTLLNQVENAVETSAFIKKDEFSGKSDKASPN